MLQEKQMHMRKEIKYGHMPRTAMKESHALFRLKKSCLP